MSGSRASARSSAATGSTGAAAPDAPTTPRRVTRVRLRNGARPGFDGAMTRGVVGLLLEVVFFGIAFGVRSWVQWRRTGSTGFIRPRRGAPATELLASTMFVTSIVLLAVGPIADLAGTGRIDVLDSAAIAAIGLVLTVAGIVLTTIAQLS